MNPGAAARVPGRASAAARTRAVRGTGMTGATILLAAILALASGAAGAHRLRPAMAVLDVGTPGAVTLRLTINAEALLAGIGPQHEDASLAPQAGEYAALRALPAERLRARIRAAGADIATGIALALDGDAVIPVLDAVEVPEVPDPADERLSTLVFNAPAPHPVSRVSWRYDPRFGASALRITGAPGAAPGTLWLQPGEASGAIGLGGEAAAVSHGDVFGRYVVLGFTHIVPHGLDHVLFVLGIFLLSLRLKPLLWQVTAFTVAHSITLTLALFGVVSLPVAVVEPLIAASIVWVAVENLFTARLSPWRVYVVFAFGLLHGLGFAGVLTGLGLPAGAFVTALVAFNVGVEAGQLAVIAIAFLAVGLWFRHRAWYRRAVVIPVSTAIALTGGWWTVSRLV